MSGDRSAVQDGGPEVNIRQDDVPLLEASGLEVVFRSHRGRRRQPIRAVSGVSLRFEPGETLGIVGESGSGKSTLARALLRLVEASGGTVRYRGTDLLSLGPREMRAARRHMQMVFQDPYASLHPRHTIAELVSEPWRVHKAMVAPRERPRRVAELLGQVGLPSSYAHVYPVQLSGGQRQRVSIARALASEPAILILDEPVSALDVSIQAQMITLLKELQQRLGLAYVFISHDLALVKLVSDRVAVMYRGEFVETGSAEEVYANPRHEYTQKLLAASPAAHAV